MIARDFGDLVIGVVLAALAASNACSSSATAGTAQASLSQSGSLRQATDSSASRAEFVVDTMTVDGPLDLPAQLYVEHDAVVVARSQGTIDSLYAEIGDRVAAGQLLAQVERADQEIALASADAALENLEHAAARARTLTKFSGATAADSEQVEFQLRQANIARRKARRDLELTRVVAPFDGVVSARFIRPRRYVAVGDTLFRVTETTPLYARVRVPEASARFAHIGERAVIVGVDRSRSTADVVHTSPVVDAASGTREAVVRIAGSPGPFMPGEAVRVQLGRERRRVLVVPRAAIAPDGYALVVENGHTTLRPVILGADLGAGRVEIVSGLSLAERLARPGR